MENYASSEDQCKIIDGDTLRELSKKIKEQPSKQVQEIRYL